VGGIVYQSIDPFRPGAVGTAIDFPFTLDPMSENPTSAAVANGSDYMRRALEGIERVSPSGNGDIETFVIGISAVVAGFHGSGVFAGDVPIVRPSTGRRHRNQGCKSL